MNLFYIDTWIFYAMLFCNNIINVKKRAFSMWIHFNFVWILVSYFDLKKWNSILARECFLHYNIKFTYDAFYIIMQSSKCKMQNKSVFAHLCLYVLWKRRDIMQNLKFNTEKNSTLYRAITHNFSSLSINWHD